MSGLFGGGSKSSGTRNDGTGHSPGVPMVQAANEETDAEKAARATMDDPIDTASAETLWGADTEEDDEPEKMLKRVDGQPTGGAAGDRRLPAAPTGGVYQSAILAG